MKLYGLIVFKRYGNKTIGGLRESYWILIELGVCCIMFPGMPCVALLPRVEETLCCMMPEYCHLRVLLWSPVSYNDEAKYGGVVNIIETMPM